MKSNRELKYKRKSDNRQEERTEQPRSRDRGPASKTEADKSIKFLYTNTQGVQNKIRALQAVANYLDPDFILLTETRCNTTT